MSNPPESAMHHYRLKGGPPLGTISLGLTEAVEAIEVIEAAEVLRPGKSLLRTSDSSRF